MRRSVFIAAFVALLVTVPIAVAAFSATSSNGPNNFTAAATFPDTLEMATGSYTGNSASGRAIDIGFQPDYVIVKADASQIAVARTSTMPANQSKPMTGATALSTARIQSFTSTGFTVGNNAQVNFIGVTYNWVAFKARAGVMKVGSYTGNGTSQSPDTTFGPEYVAVFGADPTSSVQRFAGMTSSFRFESATGTANAIDSLDASGFTVGTGAEANANGDTYHYVAFNDVSGVVENGTYTGNNTNNRQITGLNLEPGYVNIRANDTGTARNAHHRPASVSGTESQFFSAVANSTNGIRALLSDGFQLGTDASVNATGVTYHYMAFKNTGGGCSQPGSQTITTSGDAWFDQAAPTTNFGNDSVLKVASKGPSNNMRAVVNFALPSVPSGCSLTGATLRMYNKSPVSGRTLQALRNTASWTETGVNWNNQPATDATAATAATPSSSAWMQWNVLTQVQAMYPNSAYGFKIRDATENAGGIEQQFDSDDSGGNVAQLVLTFG